MTCYPVYIPTLNRYEHFRECRSKLPNGNGPNCRMKTVQTAEWPLTLVWLI